MALQCPKCKDESSYVLDSRGVDGGVRRRRECLNCGCRFTTYESPKDTAKRTIMKELGPILAANIKEAIVRSFKEIKD